MRRKNLLFRAARGTAVRPKPASEPKLFDPNWYLERNPDVATNGMNPFEHYQIVGWKEGRCPHPLFDPSWYVRNNSDIIQDGLEPLDHYLEVGWLEGRSPHPLFDVAWYLRKNPDVYEQGVEPLQHYLAHGWQEKRSGHPLFDTAWYLERYEDVRTANIDPLTHYIEIGWSEDRQPNELFLPKWYRYSYSHSKEINPLIHYIMYSRTFSLKPNVFFDPEWYRLTYPDAVIGTRDPFEHFLNEGEKEERRPNPHFDTSWYKNHHSDLHHYDGSILAHFINYGIWEGRNPNKYFDTTWYDHEYAEYLQGLSAFEHYISWGENQNFQQNEAFKIAYEESYGDSIVANPDQKNENTFLETVSSFCVSSFVSNRLAHRPFLVFFANNVYPSLHELGGYRERVNTIDKRLDHLCRIYVVLEERTGDQRLLEAVGDGVFVFRLKRNKLEFSIAKQLCRSANGVYSHSIYPLADPMIFEAFCEGRKRVIDFHGVVPEELEFNGKLNSSQSMATVEDQVVNIATHILCVSFRMQRYLEQKYVKIAPGICLVVPILPELPDCPSIHQRIYSSPSLIYAGGNDHWQNFGLMINAACKTSMKFHLYTLHPQQAIDWIRDNIPTSCNNIEINHTSEYELLWRAYQRASYGFALRSKSIINDVACPTKIVQYLSAGVIPIFIDCDYVGDFNVFGVQWLSLDNLISGNFPSENELFEMQSNNLMVFYNIRRLHYEGLNALLNDIIQCVELDLQ